MDDSDDAQFPTTVRAFGRGQVAPIECLILKGIKGSYEIRTNFVTEALDQPPATTFVVLEQGLTTLALDRDDATLWHDRSLLVDTLVSTSFSHYNPIPPA
jgi:hypothetical protein